MSRPHCSHCGCTIADGVVLHRLSPNGERFGVWVCDMHKDRPISAYNLLLRKRDELRDTLAAVRQTLAAAGHDGKSDDAACEAIRLIDTDGVDGMKRGAAERVMSGVEAGRSAFRQGKPREGMLNESARIGWDEAAHDSGARACPWQSGQCPVPSNCNSAGRCLNVPRPAGGDAK